MDYNPKGGRPPLPPGQAKQVLIGVKVSEEQAAQIDARCGGKSGRVGWVRRLIERELDGAGAMAEAQNRRAGHQQAVRDPGPLGYSKQQQLRQAHMSTGEDDR